MKPALRVYLRDNGILAGRFFQIKKHLGVTSDTEVLRLLINRYWNEHREEFQPTYRYFNVNDDGVTILDLENNQTIHIRFTPEGLYCETCKANMCLHIQFALSQPEVQACAIKIMSRNRESQ